MGQAEQLNEAAAMIRELRTDSGYWDKVALLESEVRLLQAELKTANLNIRAQADLLKKLNWNSQDKVEGAYMELKIGDRVKMPYKGRGRDETLTGTILGFELHFPDNGVRVVFDQGIPDLMAIGFPERHEWTVLGAQLELIDEADQPIIVDG